ncbi:30S ribosomal protein S3 [Pseudomonas sp. LPH1]|nr:30S ribosomal protein S3 [Pseudomonas sp. LPH1]AQZ32863.1 30S ribosomal protein S3 [Pseudomonas sp. LPH1]
MDYFIIVVTTAAGLYLHWWLFRRIRQWSDRDLALSFAEGDERKRQYMLEQLARARGEGIKRRELPEWLEQVAAQYPGSRA